MKLLCSKYFLFVSFCIFYLFACRGPFFGGMNHCQNYTFDPDKKTFVDPSNQPVTCTLADNVKIFEYIPGKGCDFWRSQYHNNETVQFTPMVVQLGEGDQGAGRKYCVLQRYIEHDNSGQVILVGDSQGAFCFTSPKNNQVFTFSMCDNVYRANKKTITDRRVAQAKAKKDEEDKEKEKEKNDNK